MCGWNCESVAMCSGWLLMFCLQRGSFRLRAVVSVSGLFVLQVSKPCKPVSQSGLRDVTVVLNPANTMETWSYTRSSNRPTWLDNKTVECSATGASRSD